MTGSLKSSSKAWATQYNFPAITKGRVIKEQIATKNVEGMQCWCLNLRRDKFKDQRVRRAFNLAFDFEWSNANLFFGQYTRSRSFFNKSDMEAQGLPDAEELATLEPLRGKIPDAVFATPYANPVNATPQDRRKNLREAAKLLQDAGWMVTQSGAQSSLQNTKGEKFEVEFLLDSPLFERIALPYQQQLQLLGISATIKTPDSAQYERRMQNFDFDIAVAKWAQSQSPGNEQRDFWGSAAAARDGSRNYAGIADPAIDQIIEKIVFAPDRPKLVAACKALDRVLMANEFVVPMWFLAASRIARWDRFSYQSIPDFSLGFPSTWWWDEEKAKAVAARA
ncbi:ABC transporter substrate-binding protein [Aestuariivirga sp.]|uniref:ABC transporter substrate-binding protein n=1 Tax=Aestuariivirga sp. TaxID=2650926 RepID=UPI0039E30ECA